MVARFISVQYTKIGRNTPNNYKIHQMSVKPKFSIPRPSKIGTYTKIGIFGMQIYHLTTLICEHLLFLSILRLLNLQLQRHSRIRLQRFLK
jgi:hypothetical protein